LGNDVQGFDFEELGRRAERQAAEVEERRLEAAEVALVTARSKPVAATKAKAEPSGSHGGRRDTWS
jgi:hypothetical protein